MTIDINVQLSHMLADEIGASGDETAVLDTVHLSTSSVTRDNLAGKVMSTFKIEIGKERLDRAVKRLMDSGKIVQSTTILSLSPKAIEDINRASRENRSIEKEALDEWCKDFSDQSESTYSKDELEQIRSIILEFIRIFFLTHGADCYDFITGKKPQNNTKIDQIAQTILQGKTVICHEKMVSYLIGLFTRELSSAQESFLLLQLKKAVHYLSMVVEKTTLDTIFTALKGIIVYLDTTILYRLLNLQGSNRYESIRQLIAYCQKTSISLKVFQCTVEEMKRRIRYDARVIAEHPTPVAFSAIGYKCRNEENYVSTFWKEQSKTGISSRDFNYRYSDILAHLDSLNIEVDNQDYITRNSLQNQLNEIRQKVRDYGVSSDYVKSDNAIEHDAECLTIIESLQRKNAASVIEAQTMFLSTDWSLIRLQRNDHEYKQKTDLVALPSQLMQIFCLSTPNADYYEAFLGLFASSHTAFGTGQLNNSQIQEIMGRVASYSEMPALAEKVLCNQLIQSKFTEQETEDSKAAIIDEAILEEVEQMEATLVQQLELIGQKNSQLEEKDRLLEESKAETSRLHHDNIEGNRNLINLNARLEKIEEMQVKIKGENVELQKFRQIVYKQNARKARFIVFVRIFFAIFLLVIGSSSIVISLGALVPFTSGIVEPMLSWLKSSQSITGESTGVLIGILIAIGAVLIPCGVGMIKPGPKKLITDLQDRLFSKQQSQQS